MATSTSTGKIETYLGAKSESLLGFNAPKISKDRLHLPGPDFVDRIWTVSNRNIRVLTNLQRMFNHGRLARTGYLSILPVDQGIEHSAGASFAKDMPGFGLDFKKAVKRRYPALVALHPYGEVLPRPENRVTVEGTPLDAYGVPIARIEYKIGDNERRMAAEMYDTAESILHAAKAEIVPFERNKLDVNGSAIHEHGTCRMGADPKRSALNGFCQSHDVPNMFVVDGSAFTTATEKNPTLTILALAWRATDYLAQEMKASRL